MSLRKATLFALVVGIVFLCARFLTATYMIFSLLPYGYPLDELISSLTGHPYYGSLVGLLGGVITTVFSFTWTLSLVLFLWVLYRKQKGSQSDATGSE